MTGQTGKSPVEIINHTENNWSGGRGFDRAWMPVLLFYMLV
jgi:hypothetical protein